MTFPDDHDRKNTKRFSWYLAAELISNTNDLIGGTSKGIQILTMAFSSSAL
jgi:hypothetical protein